MRSMSTMALLFCFATTASASDTVTGSVRNESRGLPVIGEEVVLIRLDQGMQEEAHAKSDAQGRFALTVLFPNKPHLVRVVHQNVNYDQAASAGGSLLIPVFDAAPRVPDVSGSIEILRAGTNGRLLHVSDMYEIKNESSPPLTQNGEHTFEVYLPAAAKIDSVLAAGPGKIGEMIPAMAVAGEPGHYAVDVPLRPGVTKFAFNYDLPYMGHATFRTRHAYPTELLAVMIPSSMRFSAVSSGFTPLATGSEDFRVRTASRLKAGQGPWFEMSGTGALPPLRNRAETAMLSQLPVFPNTTVFGANHATLRPFLQANSGLRNRRWRAQWPILMGASCVLLAACALAVRRIRKIRGGIAREAAFSDVHRAPSCIL